MASECHWGVESGKLMYQSTFEHVPTRVYMSYRPNEPLRKQYMFAVYCLAEQRGDKNVEQRINIKFCVKMGECASGTLALLTLAYGEYAMKK
jgi:hypothetical protein